MRQIISQILCKEKIRFWVIDHARNCMKKRRMAPGTTQEAIESGKNIAIHS
jgi:hypothetical protein